MKVATTARDPQAIDTRSRENARSSSDQSDNSSQPFDGVLADVGADGKASSDKNVVTKTDGQASVTTSGTADSVAGMPATDPSFDALISIFGKGAAGANAAGSTDPKTASGAKQAKVPTKHGSADSDSASPTTPSPTAGPSDLVTMLLAGGAGAPIAQAASSTPGTGGGSAKQPTATGGDPVTSPTDTKSAASAGVGISDISVSTHLAPFLDGDAGLTLPGSKAAETLGAAKANLDAASGGSTNAQEKGVSISALGSSDTMLGPTLGPIHSIAKAIEDLAPAQPPSASASNTSASADVSKPFVSVARTLNLKLSPESLGTVDIRLHATGQTLDVQLTVSNAETLGIVNRDRDVLASALQDQNYQVNSLVIQDGGAGASSGGNNAAQQGQTWSGGSRSDSQNGGGGFTRGGDRQGQDAQQSGSEQRRPSTGSTSRSSDDSGRALFI